MARDRAGDRSGKGIRCGRLERVGFGAALWQPPGHHRADSRARLAGDLSVAGERAGRPDLDGKRLGILLELLPDARRIDALAGSDTANAQHFEELREAARARGVELVIRSADTYDAIAPAIEAAKASAAAGLNVLGSALLFGNRRVIIERTAVLGLPAIYQWPENVREGGLIGYGPSITRIYREQAENLGPVEPAGDRTSERKRKIVLADSSGNRRPLAFFRCPRVTQSRPPGAGRPHRYRPSI